MIKKKSLILRDEALFKWLKNVAMFTAPCLAIFFGQLALGVDLKKAGLVALLALYGILADYLKKLKQ